MPGAGEYSSDQGGHGACPRGAGILVGDMDKQVKRCIDICRHRNVLQRPNQRGGVGGNRGDIRGGLGDSGKSGTY